MAPPIVLAMASVVLAMTTSAGCASRRVRAISGDFTSAVGLSSCFDQRERETKCSSPPPPNPPYEGPAAGKRMVIRGTRELCFIRCVEIDFIFLGGERWGEWYRLFP